MNIVCVMVQTANGKITEGTDVKVYKWTSVEDKKHFEGMLSKFNLIVMGSSTYEAAKKVIKPDPAKLRIILTRTPERYAAESIPGQLEFSSDSPQEIVKKCEEKGYREMLLAGGGQINALFLNAGLVNELYLTVEPVVFGQGKNMVDETTERAELQLQSVEKLNEKGTLLLHYIIERTP